MPIGCCESALDGAVIGTEHEEVRQWISSLSRCLKIETECNPTPTVTPGRYKELNRATPSDARESRRAVTKWKQKGSRHLREWPLKSVLDTCGTNAG